MSRHEADADNLTWLQLPAQHESLGVFREFILQQADKVSFPPARLLKLELVIEELLVNVISYAYTEDEVGTILVGCGLTGGHQFCLQLRDRGKPFNPLAMAKPDITLDVDEREIGGLGVYFVLKVVDEAHYEWSDGWNRFTLCFDLNR